MRPRRVRGRPRAHYQFLRGALWFQRKQSMETFRSASMLPSKYHQVDAKLGANNLQKQLNEGYIKREQLGKRLPQVEMAIKRWEATNLTRPADINYTPSELTRFGQFLKIEQCAIQGVERRIGKHDQRVGRFRRVVNASPRITRFDWFRSNHSSIGYDQLV